MCLFSPRLFSFFMFCFEQFRHTAEELAQINSHKDILAVFKSYCEKPQGHSKHTEELWNECKMKKANVTTAKQLLKAGADPAWKNAKEVSHVSNISSRMWCCCYSGRV